MELIIISAWLGGWLLLFAVGCVLSGINDNEAPLVVGLAWGWTWPIALPVVAVAVALFSLGTALKARHPETHP